MKNKNDITEDEDEVDEIIIDAKQKNTKKETRACNCCCKLNLKELPILSAFISGISIILILISKFFAFCSAITVAQIFACISALGVICAVAILFADIIKENKIKPSYWHAITLIATILLLI
ncbi:MAG: hypothetical protein RR400_04055 [Clostridia bacterium]